MIRTVSILAAAGLLAACANGMAPRGVPGDVSTAAAPETEAACRTQARREFQQIPVVSSGRTAYLPGEYERLYRTCLRERHASGR